MSETKSFVREEALMLLDENSREFDLFDISSLVNKFLADIDSMSGSKMVALVGPYGSGKSTYLNIAKSRLDSSTHKWLEFDAWKYPDKKDIWEGFVLDISEQISPLKTNDVSDQIKGVPTRKDNLFKTLLESLNLFLVSQGIPLAGGNGDRDN